MTYLWSGMILIGILYGGITGNFKEVTQAVVSSSKEAVNLCISMAGVIAVWTGIMRIAENTGLVRMLSKGMGPVLKFLFPRLERDSKACEYISLNFLSNILGLGWAATPAGLKAMEELAKQNGKRREASNEMCTFLILNVSSLQLIPVNIIAYRSQYGSVDPAAIVGPGIVATTVSTAIAVLFCKVMDRRSG
jgi:spore maturation protein A